ncbi:MAG: class I SAM-dependent methyltransferase [Chloroflexi bacterium]|nr:class I SAM-dependent methyltransferase [Chloroflexota bacterium]
MENINKWLAYNELAWTEPIIAPPEEYAEETEQYIKVIKEHSKIEVKTLLHIGCGAGGNDYTFKEHFKVTGVDISENMLEIARHLNPEVAYFHGDMRTIELDGCFDAVAIPDSIAYMAMEEDLQSALVTAQKHLKPGGVLLIVASTAEQFSQNNFIYTGTRGDIEITVFENNYIPDPAETIYEATLIYLIRRQGELEIYTDRHILGLFKLQTWLGFLKKAGFDIVNQTNIDHAYDRFIAGEGKYQQLMLVCRKNL